MYKGVEFELQLTLVISNSLISNNRLSRTENLVLPKREHLTTAQKYCGKEEKLLLRSSFSSFPQYFNTYISNCKSPITYVFVKCSCSSNFFLSSANLICRGTDISKYLIESLGIRVNESRLYYQMSSNIRNHTFEHVRPAKIQISLYVPAI